MYPYIHMALHKTPKVDVGGGRPADGRAKPYPQTMYLWSEASMRVTHALNIDSRTMRMPEEHPHHDSKQLSLQHTPSSGADVRPGTRGLAV